MPTKVEKDSKQQNHAIFFTIKQRYQITKPCALPATLGVGSPYVHLDT